MRAERREEIAEVERVVGVSVEIGADRQPRSRDLVDHGSVAQTGGSKLLPLKVTSCGCSSAILSTNADISCFSVLSPI
jgi:hypothetical protein